MRSRTNDVYLVRREAGASQPGGHSTGCSLRAEFFARIDFDELAEHLSRELLVRRLRGVHSAHQHEKKNAHVGDYCDAHKAFELRAPVEYFADGRRQDGMSAVADCTRTSFVGR